MRKSSFIILSSIVIFAGASNSFADISINSAYAIAPDGTLTTPYYWAAVETFNSYPVLDQPQWTWYGSGDGELGSDEVNSDMRFAAPYDNALMGSPDSTYYYSTPVSIPEEQIGLGGDWDWAMVDFGLEEEESVNYLGLFWGSMDTYNTIEFLNDGQVVESFSGSLISDPYPADGNQKSKFENHYVNFYNLPDFDAVRFISTDYAFEFDNLAIGLKPVPAPAAFLLALIGMGLAGLKLRRFV